MPDYTEPKTDPTKAKPVTPTAPSDPTADALLYMKDIRDEQKEQTLLLKSIKNGVTFFVVIVILAFIVQACTLLLS